MTANKIFIYIFLLLFFIQVSLCADDQAQAAVMRQVALLPFSHLSANTEYDYLEMQLFHVFRLMLEKNSDFYLLLPGTDFPELDGVLPGKNIAAFLPANAVCSLVIGEYHVAENMLYISILIAVPQTMQVIRWLKSEIQINRKILDNVAVLSGRVSEVLSAEMNENHISRYPLNRQNIDLHQKLETKKALKRDVFSRRNYLLLSPGTGFSTGRTAVSWTLEGPLLSPLFNLEYGRLLGRHFHIKGCIEGLPVDLLTPDKRHREFSVEVLAGYHTQDLVSFYISGGLALVFDNNQECAALASGTAETPVFPEVERFSVSVPVQAGMQFVLKERWFADIRLRYNGLTWTIESSDPASYPEGERVLLYRDGWSPYSLLNISMSAQIGFRF